jgi:hypothetical protein
VAFPKSVNVKLEISDRKNYLLEVDPLIFHFEEIINITKIVPSVIDLTLPTIWTRI